MEQIIKDIETRLQNNLDQQNSLNQKIALLPKGHINVLYRNNKGYYYLTYRDKDKIKNQYLGPVGKCDLSDIMNQLTQRDKLTKELKHLKEQEKELRKILGKNKKNAIKREN